MRTHAPALLAFDLWRRFMSSGAKSRSALSFGALAKSNPRPMIARSLLRASSLQIRRGSTWASARWSEAIRAESNVDTPEDPPTKPLPEQHELGHGVSDFSNWVEKHEDVSSAQAIGGFVGIMGLCFAIHEYAIARVKQSDPTFTLREFPTVERDIPTWEDARHVRKE